MLSRVIAEAEQIMLEFPVWRAAQPIMNLCAIQNSPASGPRVSGTHEANHSHTRSAELESRLEQRVRDSYQSGLHDGEASAKAQAEAQVSVVLEQLGQTITDIKSVRRQLFRQAEADILKLSIEVARRVLHREITLDPLAVEALVRVALDKIRDRDIYKVRVHPDYEKIIRDVMQQVGNSANVQIVADPTLERGGAVFELDCGKLDASIEAQLKEIEGGLADSFAQLS